MQVGYTKESRRPPSWSIVDPRLPQTPPQIPSAAFDLGQAHSIPALKISAFSYYVDELNKGRLHVGTNAPAGQLVSGFTDLFLNFGIPLSPKAKVEVSQKNDQWTITEAPGATNGGAQYIVRAVRQTQKINGVDVPVV